MYGRFRLRDALLFVTVVGIYLATLVHCLKYTESEEFSREFFRAAFLYTIFLVCHYLVSRRLLRPPVVPVAAAVPWAPLFAGAIVLLLFAYGITSYLPKSGAYFLGIWSVYVARTSLDLIMPRVYCAANGAIFPLRGFHEWQYIRAILDKKECILVFRYSSGLLPGTAVANVPQASLIQVESFLREALRENFELVNGVRERPVQK